MLKRHEVEILLKAGDAKTAVAPLSGVSLRSVKRIAEESAVVHVDDAAERGKRQIGRPSTVANFRKQVIAILQETPSTSKDWGTVLSRSYTLELMSQINFLLSPSLRDTDTATGSTARC